MKISSQHVLVSPKTGQIRLSEGKLLVGDTYGHSNEADTISISHLPNLQLNQIFIGGVSGRPVAADITASIDIKALLPELSAGQIWEGTGDSAYVASSNSLKNLSTQVSDIYAALNKFQFRPVENYTSGGAPVAPTGEYVATAPEKLEQLLNAFSKSLWTPDGSSDLGYKISYFHEVIDRAIRVAPVAKNNLVTTVGDKLAEVMNAFNSSITRAQGAVDSTAGRIIDVFDAFNNSIKTTAEAVASTAERISGVFTAINEGITTASQTVIGTADRLKGVFDAITQNIITSGAVIMGTADKFSQFINAFNTGILQGATAENITIGTADRIYGFINAFNTGITGPQGVLQSTQDKVAQFFGAFNSSIKDGAREVQTTSEKVYGIFSALDRSIAGIGSTADRISNVFTTFTTAVNAVANIPKKINDTAEAIKSVFTSFTQFDVSMTQLAQKAGYNFAKGYVMGAFIEQFITYNDLANSRVNITGDVSGTGYITVPRFNIFTPGSWFSHDINVKMSDVAISKAGRAINFVFDASGVPSRTGSSAFNVCSTDSNYSFWARRPRPVEIGMMSFSDNTPIIGTSDGYEYRQKGVCMRTEFEYVDTSFRSNDGLDVAKWGLYRASTYRATQRRLLGLIEADADIYYEDYSPLIELGRTWNNFVFHRGVQIDNNGSAGTMLEQKNMRFPNVSISSLPSASGNSGYIALCDIVSYGQGASKRFKYSDGYNFSTIATEEWVSSVAGGTVTSVGLSGSNGITVSGSPVTTSGTMYIGLNDVDVAKLHGYPSDSSRFLSGDSGWRTAVTSVSATGANGITVSGSPVTTSGTMYIGLNDVDVAKLHGYPSDSSRFLSGDSGWRTAVTSVSATGSNGITVSGSPITTTGSISFGLNDIETSKLHGYPNDATKYLRGDGEWSAVPNEIPTAASNYYVLTSDTSTGPKWVSRLINDGNLNYIAGASAYSNYSAASHGSANTVIGNVSASKLTTKSCNTIVGAYSGANCSGDKNVCLGFLAGTALGTTGIAEESNYSGTFIGTEARPSSWRGKNRNAIGYKALSSADNSMVLGGTSKVEGIQYPSVGIGVESPEYSLHVGKTNYDKINARSSKYGRGVYNEGNNRAAIALNNNNSLLDACSVNNIGSVLHAYNGDLYALSSAGKNYKLTREYVDCVRMTGTNGISISGSPITTAGTININFSANLNQVLPPKNEYSFNFQNLTNVKNISADKIFATELNGELSPAYITGYPGNSTKFLRGDGTWATGIPGVLPLGGASMQVLQTDGADSYWGLYAREDAFYANVSIGYRALGNNVGQNNTIIGRLAAANLLSGVGNTSVGADSLSINYGDWCTALGVRAGSITNSLRNVTSIGAFSGSTVSNAVILGGNDAATFITYPNVGIGNNAPVYSLHIDKTTYNSGNNRAALALNNNDSLLDSYNANASGSLLHSYNGDLYAMSASGNNYKLTETYVTSVAVTGSNGITVSGSPITTSGTISLGLNSIDISKLAGYPNSTTKYLRGDGTWATGTGVPSGGSNTQILQSNGTSSYWGIFGKEDYTTDWNVSLGQYAHEALSGGEYNTSLGRRAGQLISTGGGNTLCGYRSGDAITTGSQNTGVGVHSLSDLVDGSRNISLGQYAGSTLVSGIANTLIGFYSGVSGTGSTASFNRTALGARAVSSIDNSLILGGNNSTDSIFYPNVGIGKNDPVHSLHVSNTFYNGGNNRCAIAIDTSTTVLTPAQKNENGCLLWVFGGNLYAMNSNGTSTLLTDTGEFIDCQQLDAYKIYVRNSTYGYNAGPYIYSDSSTIKIGAPYPMIVMRSISNYGAFNPDGKAVKVSGSSGSQYFALEMTGRVIATEFNAVSSREVKNILSYDQKTVAVEALEVFKRINFAKYEYKDAIINGSGHTYGMIAEDVGAVDETYVSDNYMYAPNIMDRYSIVSTTESTTTIRFTRNIDEALQGKIKLLLLDGGEKETEIISHDNDVMTVTGMVGEGVAYGTWKNCPTITKNKVFELGLVVVKDLLDRVEKLEKICYDVCQKDNYETT